jgi:hypothetical protein
MTAVRNGTIDAEHDLACYIFRDIFGPTFWRLKVTMRTGFTPVGLAEPPRHDPAQHP